MSFSVPNAHTQSTGFRCAIHKHVYPWQHVDTLCSRVFPLLCGILSSAVEAGVLLFTYLLTYIGRYFEVSRDLFTSRYQNGGLGTIHPRCTILNIDPYTSLLQLVSSSLLFSVNYSLSILLYFIFQLHQLHNSDLNTIAQKQKRRQRANTASNSRNTTSAKIRDSSDHRAGAQGEPQRLTERITEFPTREY